MEFFKQNKIKIIGGTAFFLANLLLNFLLFKHSKGGGKLHLIGVVFALIIFGNILPDFFEGGKSYPKSPGFLSGLKSPFAFSAAKLLIFLLPFLGQKIGEEWVFYQHKRAIQAYEAMMSSFLQNAVEENNDSILIFSQKELDKYSGHFCIKKRDFLAWFFVRKMGQITFAFLSLLYFLWGVGIQKMEVTHLLFCGGGLTLLCKIYTDFEHIFELKNRWKKLQKRTPNL